MRWSILVCSSLFLTLLGCSRDDRTDDASDQTLCGDDDCGEPTGAVVDAGSTKKDASAPKLDASATTVVLTKPDASEPSQPDASVVDAASPPVDTSKPDPAMLPKPKGTCPEFKDGDVTFAGVPVRIYVGNDGESKLGPLVFYWYATGSNASEVTRGLSTDIINEIKGMGGMVAVFEKSLGTGQSTGNFVWFVDDYNVADEVLACALEKKVGIDTSHIHAIGFSAGGLQSSWMAYARNNYIASIVAYSGGLTGLGAGTWVTPVDDTPDPTNVVSAMLVHGAPGKDVVIMDFAAGSAAMEDDIKMRGGFSLDCNHGGGHMIPTGVAPSSWQYMKDHPYKLKADPYANGIPAGFPKYCKIP